MYLMANSSLTSQIIIHYEHSLEAAFSELSIVLMGYDYFSANRQKVLGGSFPQDGLQVLRRGLRQGSTIVVAVLCWRWYRWVLDAEYWNSRGTPGTLLRCDVGAILNRGPVLNAQARALCEWRGSPRFGRTGPRHGWICSFTTRHRV